MTIKCKIQFLPHLLVIRDQLLRMAGAINMITPHAAVFVNNTCTFCCMHESGAADLPWCHILYFTLNFSMIPGLLSHVKSMLKGTTLNQAAPAWILALFQHKLSYQVDGSLRCLRYPSMNMFFFCLSSFNLALSLHAWWGWFVCTSLVTNSVYWTRKTICHPVCLEGTHESILIPMYKHRSLLMITANKQKRADTDTLRAYTEAGLAAP